MSQRSKHRKAKNRRHHRTVTVEIVSKPSPSFWRRVMRFAVGAGGASSW